MVYSKRPRAFEFYQYELIAQSIHLNKIMVSYIKLYIMLVVNFENKPNIYHDSFSNKCLLIYSFSKKMVDINFHTTANIYLYSIHLFKNCTTSGGMGICLMINY